MAELNPIRYRGYYQDTETGLYYLQSRYYDPATMRFINADDPRIIQIGAEEKQDLNLYAYCVNDPVNEVDPTGHAAINVICAAIGGLSGWFFGDFVAKKLGYYSGFMYWTIRAGVVIGGAVIGWFAGTLLAKIISLFLKSNPSVLFKLGYKMKPSLFYSALNFLGINPFTLATDSSKFIAIARIFNNKAFTLDLNWVKTLYDMSKRLGYRITLHTAHNGWSWHIHINGANGKLKNLHIQIAKKAWDFLLKIL